MLKVYHHQNVYIEPFGCLWLELFAQKWFLIIKFRLLHLLSECVCVLSSNLKVLNLKYTTKCLEFSINCCTLPLKTFNYKYTTHRREWEGIYIKWNNIAILQKWQQLCEAIECLIILLFHITETLFHTHKTKQNEIEN